MPQTTGTGQVPAGVSAFYDRNLLERAIPELLHDKWGQRRMIPKNNSDSIKFRKWNALATATTPLTEGVTPTGSQMSVTDVTATLSQYGDFTILTDKVNMMVEDNVIKETTDVLGEQGGETIDEVIRNILVAGTSVFYANSVASRLLTASVILQADITRAVKYLKGQNAKKFTETITGTTRVGTVPVKASYVGICHTNTTETIENMAGFKSYEEYASQTLVDMSEIGTVKGVRFCETTKAKIFTGAGAAGVDVYATLIFGKNAYGVVSLRGQKNIQSIVKPLGSAGTADPLNQRASVGWVAWATAKILNQAWMTRIESAES